LIHRQVVILCFQDILQAVQPLNYTLPFQGWKIGERIIDHIPYGPISASPNEDIDDLIASIQEKGHGPHT